MNKQDILSEQIRRYLLENPSAIDRSKPNPYNETAQKFGASQEAVRSVWRKLRKRGLVEQGGNTGFVSSGNTDWTKFNKAYATSEEAAFAYKEFGDFSEIKKDVNSPIKTLEDLIDICEIDTTVWNVVSWEAKSYTGWIKNAEGKSESAPRYSIHAKLRKNKVETDLGLQKGILIQELKDELHGKDCDLHGTDHKFEDKNLLLEIALFDAHFGKMAHSEESGEDYDLKIAGKRYRTAINDLLSKVDLNGIGRILLPIGNDMFNVDNVNKMTTAGTPQDTDTRFHKMVRYVKDLLIDTINYLSTIAPVDAVVVSGNHDMTTTFMCGEILDAFYHANPNVIIHNEPTLRKYYVFGANSFMFTHGDREKHSDLGMIFAAEKPQIWGNTEYRFCQIGHFHHNKKIQYLSMDEFQGFSVQILPSISPNDAWHTGKGYSALRQAKAFIFSYSDGLVAELTHNVKKD